MHQSPSGPTGGTRPGRWTAVIAGALSSSLVLGGVLAVAMAEPMQRSTSERVAPVAASGLPSPSVAPPPPVPKLPADAPPSVLPPVPIDPPADAPALPADTSVPAPEPVVPSLPAVPPPALPGGSPAVPVPADTDPMPSTPPELPGETPVAPGGAQSFFYGAGTGGR